MTKFLEKANDITVTKFLEDQNAISITKFLDESETNAYTLPPLNMVPDFTAGLIYGFTGSNHLDELHTCMKDIDPLIVDAQRALEDIKSGKVIAGIKDIGDIIFLLPDAVSGCTDPGIFVDIHTIEDWAVIFKQPLKLSKTVGKNWLMHGTEIKKTITEEEADWAAKKFFDAGVATASVLAALVGPIKTARDANDISVTKFLN